jgi:hypothetical protein
VDKFTLCALFTTSVPGMRWDSLFSDLESQLEFGLNAEANDVEAEEERLRLGRLTIRDRLLALGAVADRGAGYSVEVVLVGGVRVSLRLKTIGRDWLAADLDDGSARHSQCVVPLAAIQSLLLTRRQLQHSLRPRGAQGAAGSITDRLGLPFLLRDLCRRRAGVEVRLADDTLFGTIDRVGRDHFDLAVHEAGSARREPEVQALRVVALSALVLLRI